jgi:hypothetical protein
MVRTYIGIFVVFFGVMLLLICASEASNRTGKLEGILVSLVVFVLPGILLIRSGGRAKKARIAAESQAEAQTAKCAGCGRVPPGEIFVPGRLIAGYAGFGRCETCGKIWCSECDLKVDAGTFIAHRCPNCRKTLSTLLFD